MPDQLQLRGGTTTEHETFTGASKEVTIDTTKKTAVVHDASTAGGNPLMREDGANSALVNGSVTEPALAFAAGDADNGIYSPGTDQVAVTTNGVERVEWGASEVVFNDGGNDYNFRVEGDTQANLLFVDAGTERIGVNTANPAEKLHIQDASAATIRMDNTGGTSRQGRITVTNAGAVEFRARQNTVDGEFVFLGYGGVTDSEHLRIDSSGRLLVGTTSHSFATSAVFQGNSSDAASNAHVRLCAGTATPADNAHLGRLGFGDSGHIAAAEVRVSREGGTWSTSSLPTRLQFFTCADGTNSSTERMRIDSVGRMKMGQDTATDQGPNARYSYLQIAGNSAGNTGAGISLNRGSTPTVADQALGHVYFTDGDNEYGAIRCVSTAGASGTSTPGSLRFLTTPSGSTSLQTRATIDSDGRLLVGANTAPNSGTNAVLQLANSGSTALVLARNDATVVSQDVIGQIIFMGNDGGTYQTCATIQARADNTHANNDKPTYLSFLTTADNTGSPAERMRISADAEVSFTQPNTSTNGIFVNATNGSFISNVAQFRSARAANSGFRFVKTMSQSGSDTEHNLRGDGNAYADGSWNGGGADYAEYFEWSDGNTDAEDRRGISVVLDGDKIREAVAGEEPIGVISGNPSVVGDADIERWKNKYLRDDFGTYVKDAEGDRQLNPDYNPDVEYVSREDRPEWDCVGLMGKLRIRKGQVTGARWIKMRDVSDNVEEWLVR